MTVEYRVESIKCRCCGKHLEETLVDLGMSPLANSYVSQDMATEREYFFPLKTYVCDVCLLVQLPNIEERENIFNEDYAYFSSYSESVLQHARSFVEMICDRYAYGPGHRVLEIASNDGYLLQYFRKRGVPVLGIEPSGSVASAAMAAGVPTRMTFFGVDTARQLATEGMEADLLIANNVLAHVPDLNDFVAGVKIVLGRQGVATFEFPHLLPLLDNIYYDTIYHEHFSYFSLLSVEKILNTHGLKIVDVEEIAPQGGSLRVFARHVGDSSEPVALRVGQLREREIAAGLAGMERYRGFAECVHATKRDLLRFLIDARDAGKTVVGYGAPAKGNTLLNYCGVKADLLPYTVDISPHKQGRLLPGSRIPILEPAKIFETRPDFVLILPWNIASEIVGKMRGVAEWGGRFVVPLPKVSILSPSGEHQSAASIWESDADAMDPGFGSGLRALVGRY